MNETKIKNRFQDRNSEAWTKLCDYIDKIEKEKCDEFSPLEALGPDLFSQIYTLPESIGKLKNVKKIWLYGSNLQSIPPEIGEMTALEYFDPYTSYDLHWFPYEITKCKHLIDSRVSTRALYGNSKNKKQFPDLTFKPVRYNSETIKCSVCEKELTYEQTEQKWITLRVGTDNLPLLANVCSIACEEKLPYPSNRHTENINEANVDLTQDSIVNSDKNNIETQTLTSLEDGSNKKHNEEKTEPNNLIKLIRKIWDK